MRWAGVSIFALAVAAASCAGRKTTVANAASVSAAEVAGIWDGVVRATISEGMGSGDTRIEKQEWHLAQSGGAMEIASRLWERHGRHPGPPQPLRHGHRGW